MLVFIVTIFNFTAEWPKEERSRNVKLILREKLPVENYELFKYIIEFLVQVSDAPEIIINFTH